jgi:hypothetical protein
MLSRYRNVIVGGHAFEKGNRWGRGKGNGEEGVGVSIQPTRDHSGQEFAPRHRGGIPGK